MVSQVERNRNYRQRQRARLAELEAMARNITPPTTRNITPMEDPEVKELERRLAEAKAIGKKLGEDIKALERENAELKAEVARLRPMAPKAVSNEPEPEEPPREIIGEAEDGYWDSMGRFVANNPV